MSNEIDRENFKLAVTPLIKYLAENHHPHTTVIVDSVSAEMVEGLMTIRTDEFIVD